MIPIIPWPFGSDTVTPTEIDALFPGWRLEADDLIATLCADELAAADVGEAFDSVVTAQ